MKSWIHSNFIFYIWPPFNNDYVTLTAVTISLDVDCKKREVLIEVVHVLDNNLHRTRQHKYNYTKTASRIYCQLCATLYMDYMYSAVRILVNTEEVALVYLHTAEDEFDCFQPEAGHVTVSFNEDDQLAGISLVADVRFVYYLFCFIHVC